MKKISWNPDIDPEWEDRKEFLKLSSQKRWQYLMRLIFDSKKLPKGAALFSKKKIEWT